MYSSNYSDYSSPVSRSEDSSLRPTLDPYQQSHNVLDLVVDSQSLTHTGLSSIVPHSAPPIGPSGNVLTRTSNASAARGQCKARGHASLDALYGCEAENRTSASSSDFSSISTAVTSDISSDLRPLTFSSTSRSVPISVSTTVISSDCPPIVSAAPVNPVIPVGLEGLAIPVTEIPAEVPDTTISPVSHVTSSSSRSTSKRLHVVSSLDASYHCHELLGQHSEIATLEVAPTGTKSIANLSAVLPSIVAPSTQPLRRGPTDDIPESLVIARSKKVGRRHRAYASIDAVIPSTGPQFLPSTTQASSPVYLPPTTFRDEDSRLSASTCLQSTSSCEFGMSSDSSFLCASSSDKIEPDCSGSSFSLPLLPVSPEADIDQAIEQSIHRKYTPESALDLACPFSYPVQEEFDGQGNLNHPESASPYRSLENSNYDSNHEQTFSGPFCDGETAPTEFSILDSSVQHTSASSSQSCSTIASSVSGPTLTLKKLSLCFITCSIFLLTAYFSFTTFKTIELHPHVRPGLLSFLRLIYQSLADKGIELVSRVYLYGSVLYSFAFQQAFADISLSNSTVAVLNVNSTDTTNQIGYLLRPMSTISYCFENGCSSLNSFANVCCSGEQDEGINEVYNFPNVYKESEAVNSAADLSKDIELHKINGANECQDVYETHRGAGILVESFSDNVIEQTRPILSIAHRGPQTNDYKTTESISVFEIDVSQDPNISDTDGFFSGVRFFLEEIQVLSSPIIKVEATLVEVGVDSTIIAVSVSDSPTLTTDFVDLLPIRDIDKLPAQVNQHQHFESKPELELADMEESEGAVEAEYEITVNVQNSVLNFLHSTNDSTINILPRTLPDIDTWLKLNLAITSIFNGRRLAETISNHLRAIQAEDYVKHILGVTFQFSKRGYYVFESLFVEGTLYILAQDELRENDITPHAIRFILRSYFLTTLVLSIGTHVV
ncbi:uncharacterized protein V1516DRAFT_686713 [Lipomyces oligophaga]|uniref:uncharacterized protein n=1 Tax=Lipomyces oligophaga TaxID=45792 RepID=UPI0034CEE4CB